MLEELEIHDLGPIRSAMLEPARGMTAITGETGAGKSMLLSAIRLISGGSADSGRVAPGADKAWAQGVFRVDAARDRDVVAVTEDVGVDIQDDELFLARTIPSSGRSRATLCGRSVPRSVLNAVAEHLVTVHGQADQLRIVSTTRQRDLLDSYADDDEALLSYRAVWNELQSVEERIRRVTNQEASARQQADYLRESIERIARVDPKPGEDDDLRERRDRIENSARITEGVSGALAALDASQLGVRDEGAGAIALIETAVHALRGIHMDGVFDQAVQRLESMNADLEDVVFTLSRQIDDDSETESLDAINNRIHELRELTRRWGPTLADVIAWRDKAVFDLEDLDASDERIGELCAQRDRLRTEAVRKAAVLSEQRRAAAVELSDSVTGELESLAMAGSSLCIRVTPRIGEGMLDANGCDDIEFLFTPFPGSAPLPMGKSASGGELSRLMLALELCTAGRRIDAGSRDAMSSMTFIFDEVDAGVGGKAAAELGRRLARLARSAQVIVVTHLPQVASWADSQFVVCKREADDGESVETTVMPVSGEDRVNEIARMLSGTESEASLGHARELLDESHLG